MNHLIIYLESQTLQALCEQEGYPYDLAIKAGITKQIFIDSMVQKQKLHTKWMNSTY